MGAAAPGGTHNLAGLVSRAVTRLPVTDLGNCSHLQKSISKKSRAKEERGKAFVGFSFSLSLSPFSGQHFVPIKPE